MPRKRREWDKPKGLPRGKPFPKGVSPNKLGLAIVPKETRMVEIDVRRYSRGFGRPAVDGLVQLMSGKLTIDVGTKDEPKQEVVLVAPATMLGAMVAILDRGYGKPPQAVEIAGKDGGPIITENSAYDIIRSRLDSIAERLREGANARRPDAGADGRAGVRLEVLGPPRTAATGR